MGPVRRKKIRYGTRKIGISKVEDEKHSSESRRLERGDAPCEARLRSRAANRDKVIAVLYRTVELVNST